jgi:hypothetical protein
MNKKDLKDIAKNSRPPSGAWMRMYAAVVGGQTGWLVTALDDARRLNERLNALMAVTDAALEAAKNAGKITA